MSDLSPTADLARLRQLVDDSVAWLDRDGDRLAVVRPQVSRWSPRLQIDHAALAATAICRTVAQILDGAPGVTAGGARSPQAAAILAAGRIPRGRAESPAEMVPVPDVSDADVRAHLAEVVRHVADLEPRLRGTCPPGRLPHFALGPLDASEWLRFAVLHFEHHAAIAREAIAAS